MHDNNDNSGVGFLLTSLSWISTAAVALLDTAQAGITFFLSCAVSIMAIRHYYLQDKKKK